MSLPDDFKLSRHVTAFMTGDFPKDKLAVSPPDVMVEIESIFDGYTFSPSTVFIDLRTKLESHFYSKDPLDILEKENLQQLDEYRPEADMVIWLHLQKKLSLETFWAIWEYQFADSNPFSGENDVKLKELFLDVETLIS
jgi:hypothetical protein